MSAATALRPAQPQLATRVESELAAATPQTNESIAHHLGFRTPEDLARALRRAGHHQLALWFH